MGCKEETAAHLIMLALHFASCVIVQRSADENLDLPVQMRDSFLFGLMVGRSALLDAVALAILVQPRDNSRIVADSSRISLCRRWNEKAGLQRDAIDSKG